MVKIYRNISLIDLHKSIINEKIYIESILNSEKSLNSEIMSFLKNTMQQIDSNKIFSNEIDDFIMQIGSSLRIINCNIGKLIEYSKMLDNINFNLSKSSYNIPSIVFQDIKKYNTTSNFDLKDINKSQLDSKIFIEKFSLIPFETILSFNLIIQFDCFWFNTPFASL